MKFQKQGEQEAQSQQTTIEDLDELRQIFIWLIDLC